ncbi:Nuclear transcription factor Y subunit B-11 [Sesamum alatum]|uniref:Nuclear transcription factor Y subunit B-11 n=1 Tax=Sesamum alatum TaxID=300844 RepID=A0AAE2CQD2_9LAMI|nr:Nuclear transcription factor Y subunit B-11 [Sesamum alatum]
MTTRRTPNSPISTTLDSLLPIANVSRIMKKSLPTNAKISKEAKETVQECVSEFISFVTGEASEKCQREKRKTINGDDLLWAMTTLGFENYVGPLKDYLNKYRDDTEVVRNEEHASSSPSSTHDDHCQSVDKNVLLAAAGCFQGFYGDGGVLMDGTEDFVGSSGGNCDEFEHGNYGERGMGHLQHGRVEW